MIVVVLQAPATAPGPEFHTQLEDAAGVAENHADT